MSWFPGEGAARRSEIENRSTFPGSRTHAGADGDFERHVQFFAVPEFF